MWKKIVIHLIDTVAVNIYICYQQKRGDLSKMTRYNFMIQLVGQLLGDYYQPARKRGRPSTGNDAVRLTDKHFFRYIPDKKRKKCIVCGHNLCIICEMDIQGPG